MHQKEPIFQNYNFEKIVPGTRFFLKIEKRRHRKWFIIPQEGLKNSNRTEKYKMKKVSHSFPGKSYYKQIPMYLSEEKISCIVYCTFYTCFNPNFFRIFFLG